MMYEDLVKRLRAVTDGSHEDKCDGCPYDEDYPCCVDCLDTMLKQAADAIETLSEQLAYYHGFDGFLMTHGMFGQVEWTPAEYESAQEPPKEEA